MSKDSNFVLSTITEEEGATTKTTQQVRRTSQSSSERRFFASIRPPSMTKSSINDDNSSANMPPTPKPSRSSQIQGKLNTQRKTISRKLKRAFSVNSTTGDASSKKRFTL